MFSAHKTLSITQPIGQGEFQSLKTKYYPHMIQQIIKAIDARKLIPKVSTLDTMKIPSFCWENVTEETFKSVLQKLIFQPKINTWQKMI